MGILDDLHADIRSLLQKRLMLIGLLFVPALVFFLYVGAFYQPTDNMRDTPVLLVNLDGSELSQSFETSIRESKTFKFYPSNLAYAQEAVSAGDAWAALIIPADFSARLQDGQDTSIILISDDARSYIATRVMQSTLQVMVPKMQVAYSSGVISSAAGGFSAASAQARYTQSALGAVSSGADQLQAGQVKLGASTQLLSDYGQELTASDLIITTKLKETTQYGQSLTEGLSTLRAGSSSLSSGLNTLSSGTHTLATSHPQLDTLLAQAYTTVQSMNDSAEKNQTLTLLAKAKSGSASATSALKSLDTGASSAYAGSVRLTSGLDSAVEGAGSLTDGLVRLHEVSILTTQSGGELALNTHTAASASEQLASGAAQIGTSADLLASQTGRLSTGLASGAERLREPGTISLSLQEVNKANYGTFFATAFVSLGLFFGAASAFLFCSLARLKNELLCTLVLILLQCVVLLTFYSQMGFPMRDGDRSLLVIMALSGLLFALMTRALVRVVSPVFEAAHLSLYSPILSLLAVFMISSGAAMWPTHTLQAPFSSFSPYIPMYYTVQATRMSALAGTWPTHELGVMAIFAAIFLAIPPAYGALKRLLGLLYLKPLPPTPMPPALADADPPRSGQSHPASASPPAARAFKPVPPPRAGLGRKPARES